MPRLKVNFKKIVCSWAAFCMVTQPVLVQAQSNTLRVPLGIVQTGASGGGHLAYSESALDFGQVLVKSVDTRPVTVTNSGTAAITLDSISTTGNAFTHSSNCGDYLSPGASCTVDVKFAPTVSGPASGTLVVSSDDSEPTHTIPLSGIGKAGWLRGSGYTFPDPRQIGDTLVYYDITITNPSTAPVSVSGVSVSVGTDSFSQSNNCLRLLEMNDTCTVRVGFSPSTAGTIKGTVSLVSDSDESPMNLAVEGQGRAPTGTLSAQSFGAVQVNDTLTREVTLSNTGVGPLSVADKTVTGTDYSLSSQGSGTCGASLAVGATCSFPVDFKPSVTGARPGAANVSTSAGALTASFDGSGASQSATLTDVKFGAQDVGQSKNLTATLTNNGIGALSVTAPSSSSVTGNNFSFVSTTCGTSLSKGGSCTVTVHYAPTTPVEDLGTLKISTGAGVISSGLSGTGQQAVLVFSPSSIASFGNVQVGQSADSQQVTLTNSGNVTASALSLTTAEGFSVVSSTCGTSLAASSTCTLKVRFSPTAAQAYAGNLDVTAGAPSAPAALPLSGTGVVQSASLSGIAFGSRTAGSSTDMTATLTNTGVGPLEVTAPAAASVTGTGFSFVSTNCATSVPVSGTCSVTVRFTPVSGTAYSGTLSVTTGAGLKTSALSGQGMQGVASASPTALNFGAKQVGDTSTIQSVTLSNNGNSPLAVAGISVASGGTDYAQSNNCGTIPAGGSCAIDVAFTPSAAGSRPGSLAILHDGAGVTNISLSGTGQGQSASLSTPGFTATAVGASSSATATLTNTGIGALSVTPPTAASVSGTDFSFVSTNCGTSLATGNSCTVTVQFTPTSTAARSGTLTVATGGGSKTASLSATGQQAILALSPATLPAFGNVQVGQSSDSTTVTLTNTGNIAASTLALSTPSGYSLVSNTCTTSLGVSSSCSFKVRFAPIAVQTYSGNLTASAAAPSTPASLALSGAGVAQSASLSTPSITATAVGTSSTATATLTNTGTGPLTVTVPTAANVSGADFTFASTTCTSSLAVGNSCTVTVSFAPSVVGTRTGALTVTTGAGNLNANLSGVGQQAILSLSPATTLAFGNVQVGQTADSAAMTLSNSGNVSATTLAYALPTGVTVASNTCAATLAAGSNCSITLRFAPTAAQAYSGNFTVSASAPSSAAVRAVTGTGVSQAASLSTPSFPATAVGASSTGTATLTNTGVGPLSVTTPSSASIAGTDFSFASTDCGTSLALNASCSVTVRFSPTSTTARSGTLTVATGAGNKVVSLGSTGIQGYASMSPGSLTFATYQVSTTAPTQAVTVTNTGTDTLTFTGVGISTGATDFAQTNNCGSVPVNGTCTVNVNFTPSAAGTRSGTLSFTHNGGGIANVGLSGTGQGQSATLSTPTFPTTAVGASNTAVATLANTGIGALSVTVPTTASVTGTDFSFVSTTCTASLPVSGSCTVTVRFSPTANTARSGTLTVSTGAGTQTASLSATGQQAILGFSPATLPSYGNVQVGQTVDSTAVTLTNSGNVSASTLAIGLPSGYSLASSTCGTSLAMNSSCSLTVRFAPAAAQAYSGNLTATAAAPSTAASLALTGTGVSQAGSLSTPSFAATAIGASNNAVATLTNTGVGPLSVTVPAASSVVGSDFSFVSTTCTTSLAAGSTCSVTVKFTPSAAGTRTGTLTVATGAGSLAASLSATGQQGNASVSPASLAYSSQTVSTTSGTQSVTVTNNGSAPLTISGVSVSTGASDFGQTNTCGTTLAISGTCSITVSFTPSAAGARSGTISLVHNGGGMTNIGLSGTGVAAPVISSASLSPATVTSGGTSTFTWATTDATSASVSCSGIASGTGSGTSGSITVSTTGVGSGTCTVTASNSVGNSTSTSRNLTSVAAPVVATATFSPTSVNSGGTSTFSWTTSNATSASVSCSAPASGSGSGTSGSLTVTTSGSGTGTCTVTAYNAAGTSATKSANLTVSIPLPTVTQASFSSRTLTNGNSTTFTWNTSGASSASVSCSGTASGSGTGVSGSISVRAVGTGSGTCTVTATSGGGNSTGSDTFTSVAAPSASSYFSSSTIGAGGSNTFNWSTSSATSASVSCSGVASGSGSGTSGSISVSSSASAGTGYCTVTAYNAAGSSSSSTSSYSTVNKPSASGSFSNYSPVQGSTVTFSWSTSGATTSTNVDCWGSASGTYRGSAASGSISVSVVGTGSGSCNVAAINAAGETDGTATFNAVAPPAPSVTGASFSPTSVTTGSTSTFSWSTSNATSASVSCSGAAVGSGSGTSGSITVSTSGTGTGYCTVTARNSVGATASGSGSLSVNSAVAKPTINYAYFDDNNGDGANIIVSDCQYVSPDSVCHIYFSWSVSSANSVSVSCTGSWSGASSSSASGRFEWTASTSGGSAPRGTSETCTVTATNAGGTSTASDTGHVGN